MPVPVLIDRQQTEDTQLPDEDLQDLLDIYESGMCFAIIDILLHMLNIILFTD